MYLNEQILSILKGRFWIVTLKKKVLQGMSRSDHVIGNRDHEIGCLPIRTQYICILGVWQDLVLRDLARLNCDEISHRGEQFSWGQDGCACHSVGRAGVT